MSAIETLEQPLPLTIGALEVAEDGTLCITEPPPPSQHRFTVSGAEYRVSLVPDGDGTLFQIWAQLGSVPFSTQDQPRRAAALSIMRAANGIGKTRFVAGTHQEIILLREERLDGRMTIDDLVVRIVDMIQESRPFAALLQGYAM